ncbi:MAG: hypothetical protein ACRD2N_22800, partial [Vicinamibacterales bacterium]
ANGLAGYIHVVKEDPKEPNLIYAGSELGVYASFDRGMTWTDLRLGLPRLAVVDLVVHPRDNDLVIATHARGFYILDDITPLQHIAAGRVAAAAPALFPPIAAVRYVPASDTSVLGNRVWVAPNQPYGAILNYYLPEAAPGGVTFQVIDRGGRTVSTFTGPGAKGVNRTNWNLSEVSQCGPPPPGRGPGRGGRPGGGTWIRSIPGDYSVRLTAPGTSVEHRVTVRRDPRLPATTSDMNVWYGLAQKIEKTECTLDRAAADLADVERQIAARPSDATTETLRRDLRPVVLALRGDPKDPGHVNLPARLNWLTIQVGNNSHAPTAAQMEWIGKYADQAAEAISRLEEIKARLRK